MSNFSKNLISLRQEKQLTQPQLAKAINVSNAVISFWENGINEPKATYIIQLAKFFDISTDELLGLSEEKSYVQQKKSPDKTISEDEQELLDLYRRAGQNKQDVKNIAKGYATLNDLNNSVKNSNRA